MVVRDTQLIPVEGPMRLREGEKAEPVWCRFRTLGCSPCTGAVHSHADTIEKIIEEIMTARNSERITRVIDHDRQMIRGPPSATRDHHVTDRPDQPILRRLDHAGETGGRFLEDGRSHAVERLRHVEHRPARDRAGRPSKVSGQSVSGSSAGVAHTGHPFRLVRQRLDQ